jgi:hypothetical protein
VSRFAIPLLLEKEPRFVPLGYCSIASPHMGVQRPGGGPLKSLWKHMIHGVCKNMYQQTGSDMTFQAIELHNARLEDTLLYRLSDPQGVYMQALSKFPHRTLVASPFHDMLVPYCTASGNAKHPYDEDEFFDSITEQPCIVWGYSRSFTVEQEQLLLAFARPGSAGRPEEDLPDYSPIPKESGWYTDRYSFSLWPGRVMENFNTLSFRRLDGKAKLLLCVFHVVYLFPIFSFIRCSYSLERSRCIFKEENREYTSGFRREWRFVHCTVCFDCCN